MLSADRTVVRPLRTGSPAALAVLAIALLATACATGAPPEEPVEGEAPGQEAAAKKPMPDPPTGSGAMAPDLLADGENLFLTWTERPSDGEGASRVLFSSLSGGTWSDPSVVAEGKDFFVNWADFPRVMKAGDDSLYVHWLQKSGASTYAYDVMLARSTDGGGSWSPLGSLHHDGTKTEHGFVSFVAEGSGVRAFYLDGREMEGGEGHGHEGGEMTLRTAVVGDSSGPGTQLDARTCECCQTAAAVTAAGPLVVYRDRSEGEIRDIMVVRRMESGWTEPVAVHADGWEVPGCPVNGPAVDADGDRVVVAWHTASENRPRVQVAFSSDAGASFADPVEVDDADPLGRVDVEMLPAGDAVVSWMAVEGDEGVIRLRRISPGGLMGESVSLGSTASSRGSGFPVMAARGETLYVAWTETGEPSRIRMLERSAPKPGPAATADQGGEVDQAAVREWDRKPGSMGPDYGVESLNGESWNLRRPAGEPYLLNLWATWCGPCRREMPDLDKLDREYAPRGLRVVGLSVDDPAEFPAVREMVKEMGIQYPILLDTEGGATALFGVSGLPASFLFDGDGVLVWRSFKIVMPDDPEVRAALERALDS